ncbi:acetyl-CoA synthetase-like protein [Martensiomyces pterosporus]|nr:acetyl-CoA synthetase-like protein [Martensiomyces pterosporus]
MSSIDPAVIFAAGVATVAAIVYFYYFSPQANQPDIHPLQIAQQSSVSKVRESPHESAIYRSKLAPEGTELLSTPSSELKTLRDAIRNGRRLANPKAIQYVVEEKIQAIGSDDAANRVGALAGGLLRAAKWTDSEKKSAAILFYGSPEFLVAYQACIEAGIAAIPLCVNDSLADIGAILKHSQTRVLITTSDLAMKISSSLAGTSLTHVVIAGELDGSEESDRVRGAGQVVSFEELQQGEAPEKDALISPTDAAYILYKVAPDGSGKPRGVVISHSNALAAIAGLMSGIPADKALTNKDVFMSVASMADASNLNFINTSLLLGCSICILETVDSEKFCAQAYFYQPTFTYLEPLVTRDLVQLFTSHIEKYPKFEHKMFMFGYRKVVDSFMRGVLPKLTFWDFSYFRHYRNVMGGKIRLMYIAGSTPSKHIEWLRVMHGAKVIPVFGTPQTTAIVTAGAFYDYASAIETHNVGAPVACNEIKVVDSSDSVAFTAEDKPNPRGLIAVRGPNVTTQLWNDEEVKTQDAWLTLPYYGEIMPNGTIDVVGVSQTIVKTELNQEGYIYIERLERALASSNAVTDICVVAEPKSRKISAIAHPRPMALYAAAHQMKKTYKMKNIEAYPWCTEYIRDKLVKVAKETGYEWLAELPEDEFTVKLVSAPFSMENKLALADGAIDRTVAKKILSGEQ